MIRSDDRELKKKFRNEKSDDQTFSKNTFILTHFIPQDEIRQSSALTIKVGSLRSGLGQTIPKPDIAKLLKIMKAKEAEHALSGGRHYKAFFNSNIFKAKYTLIFN